jgi:hypothetical protein
MTASVRDIVCTHNPQSEETHHVCDWCNSMLHYTPNRGWESFLSPLEHEYAIAQFGGPGHQSAQRWTNLLRADVVNQHTQWALLWEDEDPITTLPCDASSFEALAKTIADGRPLSGDDERHLQKGIGFHDGTVLRFISEAWYLDGMRLPSLSLHVLFPLLADEKARRGWNLSALILGLASCNPVLDDLVPGEPRRRQRRRFEGRFFSPHFRPLASMLVWLSNRLLVDRAHGEPSREYIPMIAWAHDIKTKLIERQHADLYNMFRSALSHHPPGLFETYDRPWLQEWLSLETTTQYPRTLDWPLKTSGRHLKFRVRTQSGGTRLINVPARPDAWALMISLSHSPLNSPAGKLLLGLQHNWTVAYTTQAPPSPSLLKSLEFCHQIMNGLSERIHIEKATALVFGQLGHAYEVRVGPGQHGAPYQIRHMQGLERHEKDAICIHSGQHTTSLPLGDTIGGVLLSMANDIKASESIDSLAEVVRSSPPFGFPSQNVPASWMNALDAESMALLKRYGSARHTWYHHRFREDEEDEGPVLFGGGLMQRNRQWIRRRQGRRSPRGENRQWVSLFESHFSDTNAFPYNEVVAQWRQTVRPYLPQQHQNIGEPFGRGMARWMRRYHHMMPHRREEDIHEEGDIRDGERRWCEVFARVWEAMSLMPLGSTIRSPLTDGEALTFEHANLTVTIRNRTERNSVSLMAHALGYTRHGEDERVQVYIRRDHPRPDAFLRLTNLLRDAQDRQGVRGAPPRWWNYREPGPAPDALQLLRWELEIDLTDDPRRRREAANHHGARWMFDQFVFDE